MNFKTLIWKNLHTRIWLFVSTILMVIVFAATMIATQVPFLRNTLELVLGTSRAITGEDRNFFESNYETKAEVLDAANELNTKITSEGFTLLRNERNSLPLAKNSKVSIFGKNSDDFLYGGAGSGAKEAGTDTKTIYDSLTSAGFTYNTQLKSFYESAASGTGRGTSPAFDKFISGFPTGETPIDDYTDAVKGSYSDSAAALVVITRVGGEGFDLPRSMGNAIIDQSNGNVTQEGSGYTDEKNVYNGTMKGARSNTDHYLQLDANEVDLLLHVTEHFDNAVLLLNTNNNLELGFLDDADYWRNTFKITGRDGEITRAMNNIRGALWIGSPGGSGIMSLGTILNGDTNPSGRTVSVHARDVWADPALQNFGNNNELLGNTYRVGGNLPKDTATRTYYVEYEEGIFMGYRYWETRAAYPAPVDAATWYEDNVMYPFGHGLSYSDFEWTVGDMKLGGTTIADNYTLAAADFDKTITVEVSVKNVSTGANAKPGKDVVQLYICVPYFSNGIEKSHVVLSDYAKTGMLQPGGLPETVKLSFSLYDIASYDYNDDNGNGFSGWETEAGTYKLYIAKNSNSWKDSNTPTRTFSVPQIIGNAPNAAAAGKGSTGFTFRKDPHTEGSADIVNRFDDVSYGRNGTKAEPKITYLSRTDWEGTFPASPTREERSDGITEAWLLGGTFNWLIAERTADVEGNPWYVADDKLPAQATSEVDPNAEDTITISDMWEVAYDDEQWDKLLDQLTIAQMVDLVGNGAFKTVRIDSIGLPQATHGDGPVGFTSFMAVDAFDKEIYDTGFYASSCILGATFSEQIAYEFGKMIGEEGLIGNERGDKIPYSGWYAPGVNIHRTPFSGRNWEYFSEDPVLSGKMAAQIVIGAKEKGVITFAKHFALNDQETSRSQRGILTWASEQAMREIYFKAFEILVKTGDSLGMMSSYNRIGTAWAGGDYRLLTEVLRHEWGFKGAVISDYATPSYCNPNQMIRAGGDLLLNQDPKSLKSDNTATQVTALRNASKNILYATANSNLMNKLVLGYRLPIWIVALIWINIGLLIAFLAWGCVAILLSYKKIKKAKLDDSPAPENN